jgi:hypothetical protein
MSDFTVADERLDRALRAVGLPFEAIFSGDAMIVVPLENGRTQAVFCDASTVTMFGDLELRRIWSPAHSSSKEPPRSLLDFMLKQNSMVWFGAWATSFSEGAVTLLFQAQVPALLSPDTLYKVIQQVGDVANEVALMVTPANR